MSDLDAIRERHVVYRNAMVQVDKVSGELAHEANEPWEDRDDWTWANLDVCDGCGQPWPCDTRVVLDALDAWKHETGNIIINTERQREAEAAHAKALADALHRCVRVVQMMQVGYRLDARDTAALVAADDAGSAALAAYDKDHER